MHCQTRSWLRILPFLGLVTACSFGPTAVGPVPPGLSEDKYGALQTYASRNLNCPQEQLKYESFGKGRHLFKGCGEEIEMLLFEGSDANAYGQGLGFVVPSPSNRFSKETQCALRDTTEERIDFRTRIVDGCGKRITYVNACNPNCSWIANVETETR